MIRILSIPLSILGYAWFLMSLIVFHPIQWICLNVFGYNAHKRSVDILSWFLDFSLYFLISKSDCYNRELIPEGKPVIFVSNHQGIFDIAGMQWYLRRSHPKFVSKIELGKGIPSVSYNLTHGGSVLIDRKNPKQALPLLKQLGEYIQKNNRSAIIYPEGTRTRDGKPKEFAPNGLKILCKYAPDAWVVPVTINNSWKVFRYGSFPLGLFNHVTFTVHSAIEVKSTDFDSLFNSVEKTIKDSVI